MDREIKKSGVNLAIAGAVGLLFFWLTDPVYGLARKAISDGSANPVDAMNEASLGTMAGLIASAGVLLLGVWVMTRRPT